ncbi:hypothetical protein HMPREF0262_03152 [Clostridium sp. ATCC 29733]|nr:hypothetical protein HMPREF0262_03152 [Clostridium sp. ATCC 29733]
MWCTGKNDIIILTSTCCACAGWIYFGTRHRFKAKKGGELVSNFSTRGSRSPAITAAARQTLWPTWPSPWPERAKR